MDSRLFFRDALLPGGWARDVLVSVGAGVIEGVAVGAVAAGAEVHLVGLPGLMNLHSHTFQRAMAGLAEYRGPGADNFWSWREQMYRFALGMGPADVEAVAAQAFVEMLEGGLCGVAEFHYLHHRPDGNCYDNIAEMAERVVAAAAEAGISMLLLPVFYAHSNFGGVAPVAGQRRFVCSLDAYGRLHEACGRLAPVGVAPHSLRAVTEHELAALLPLAKERPFHLHISEQTKEVDDCLAWCGARPIEWLLRHAPVDERWVFIHATHANEMELAGMAAAGLVAGLCPVTEANLGDGIFPAKDYAGTWGIGTDSNVLIDGAAELRQLEYAQRLHHRERNVLATAQTPATGSQLWQKAVTGGAQALGTTGGIAPGAPAHIVTLKQGAERPEAALNTAIFASRQPAIDTVWVNGRKLVVGGRHIHGEKIAARFAATLRSLG